MLKMKICVRNITKFNEKWFDLPVSMDEINKFLNDGKSEYIIVDHDLPFEISEYSSITSLNEIYESLNDSSLELTEIKALFKASTLSTEETVNRIIDGDYSILDITDPNKLLDESDFSFILYQNGYTSFLGEIPEHLIDYIDWDQAWREYNISGNWEEVIIQEDNYRQFLINIE